MCIVRLARVFRFSFLWVNTNILITSLETRLVAWSLGAFLNLSRQRPETLALYVFSDGSLLAVLLIRKTTPALLSFFHRLQRHRTPRCGATSMQQIVHFSVIEWSFGETRTNNTPCLSCLFLRMCKAPSSLQCCIHAWIIVRA